jgi:hypothetical protein
MTTKVVIATPDNSIHNSLVYVEKRQGDDTWARTAAPIVIEPHGQAEPQYIDAATRVVIEEQRPNVAQPTAAPVQHIPPPGPGPSFTPPAVPRTSPTPNAPPTSKK